METIWSIYSTEVEHPQPTPYSDLFPNTSKTSKIYGYSIPDPSIKKFKRSKNLYPELTQPVKRLLCDITELEMSVNLPKETR